MSVAAQRGGWIMIAVLPQQHEEEAVEEGEEAMRDLEARAEGGEAAAEAEELVLDELRVRVHLPAVRGRRTSQVRCRLRKHWRGWKK